MTCKGYSNSLSQVRRRMLNADVSVDDDANSLDCWRISANKSSICQSNSLQCTFGAIGPLCGACDVGFFYSSTDLLCHSCSAPVLTNIVLLAVGVVVAIIMGTLKTGLLRVPEYMQRTSVYGALYRLDSGTLRVVWSNYQV